MASGLKIGLVNGLHNGVISKKEGVSRGYTIAQSNKWGIAPNPIMWLKSNTGITLNGTTVSSWNDQTLNGNNITQVTSAAQPLFVNNAINGYPTIRFNGSNFMSFANVLTPSAISLFAVLKRSAAGVYSMITGGANSAEDILIDPTNIVKIESSGRVNQGVVNAFTSYAILGLVYNGSSCNYYLNGNLVAQSAGNPLVKMVYFGKRVDGFNFVGDFCEFLLYDSALSSELTNINLNVFKQKYTL